MARLVAPNDGAREVDIKSTRGKVRYRGTNGGIYNIDNAAHVATMKANGFTEASLLAGSRSGLGFTCSACGFEGWFRKCGKCGHIDSSNGQE